MYTVTGIPLTRTFRVLWALEELGEPYELHQHGPRSPEVQALNVSGKVPVLQAEGETITDSTAIITYLADKHRALTAPAGTIARAKQDAITHLLLDEIDAVLWAAARHSFILPEEQRVPEVKGSLKWEFGHNLARLESKMSGPFLMGEDFTIADIICTHCLNWARSAKFPVEGEKMQDYGKRMRDREAFQRVAELAR
ncbi:glutathione S-transferase family protein [Leisingera daeponensis]|uniref:glutathione S-transferase family protein n=1 Tax=Leisingera daeponensis TaxID=405746 RepID=UPI001C986F36|nr:glutathione S-transferase family protein [Leisingera daeponensis]MBY6056561.1 glutathione S-transferase family protein [Leisingera daeponensis]